MEDILLMSGEERIGCCEKKKKEKKNTHVSGIRKMLVATLLSGWRNWVWEVIHDKMNKTRIRQEYVGEGYTEPGLKIVNIWEMIGFDS